MLIFAELETGLQLASGKTQTEFDQMLQTDVDPRLVICQMDEHLEHLSQTEYQSQCFLQCPTKQPEFGHLTPRWNTDVERQISFCLKLCQNTIQEKFQ